MTSWPSLTCTSAANCVELWPWHRWLWWQIPSSSLACTCHANPHVRCIIWATRYRPALIGCLLPWPWTCNWSGAPKTPPTTDCVPWFPCPVSAADIARRTTPLEANGSGWRFRPQPPLRSPAQRPIDPPSRRCHQEKNHKRQHVTLVGLTHL